MSEHNIYTYQNLKTFLPKGPTWWSHAQSESIIQSILHVNEMQKEDAGTKDKISAEKKVASIEPLSLFLFHDEYDSN